MIAPGEAANITIVMIFFMLGLFMLQCVFGYGCKMLVPLFMMVPVLMVLSMVTIMPVFGMSVFVMMIMGMNMASAGNLSCDEQHSDKHSQGPCGPSKFSNI